jgi:hypothetical protein
MAEPSIFLAGNLTSDPQLHHHSSGAGLAARRRWPFAAFSDPPAILQRAAR